MVESMIPGALDAATLARDEHWHLLIVYMAPRGLNYARGTRATIAIKGMIAKRP